MKVWTNEEAKSEIYERMIEKDKNLNLCAKAIDEMIHYTRLHTRPIHISEFDEETLNKETLYFVIENILGFKLLGWNGNDVDSKFSAFRDIHDFVAFFDKDKMEYIVISVK